MLERALLLLNQLFGLGTCYLSQAEQLFQIVDSYRWPLADPAVEPRLGEGGLVSLVVAATAVAVHVDHHVAAELRAKVECDIDHLRDRFGLLAVDVQDRNLEHLGDVGRVGVGATLLRWGGEADLVVDDHVQSAANVVGREIAQIQGFLDDALAGECGVAVDQKSHAQPAFGVVDPIHLGANSALHHGIDVLEMARVERQGQVHLVAIGSDPIAAVSLVVLDVAAASIVLRVGVFELAKDHLRALAQDVAQYVESPTMGHAENDLDHSLAASFLDRQIEQRDEALGALQGEALGAQVLLLDEGLEHRGVGQPGENTELVVAVQGGAVLAELDPLLEPAAQLQVVDVHVLDADPAAVGVAHAVVDLLHRLHVRARDVLGRHRLEQI